MDSGELPLNEIVSLANSPASNDRKKSLAAMRAALTSEHPEYIEIARGLVGDADNDCRWQALIVLGEFIATHPDLIWELICEHGVSPDEDMRDGVATVLLEHLFEHDFASTFEGLRERILNGERMLANTLRRAWPCDDETERQWHKVDDLLIKIGEIEKRRTWLYERRTEPP
ncbi:MAG TPA: hypothetical protein VGJ26_02585 [Pirellulales bacterium]|jgi:hypothetical protein